MGDRQPAQLPDPDRDGGIDELLSAAAGLLADFGLSIPGDAGRGQPGLIAGAPGDADRLRGDGEVEGVVELGILDRLVSREESRMVWAWEATGPGASATAAALSEVVDELGGVLRAAHRELRRVAASPGPPADDVGRPGVGALPRPPVDDVGRSGVGVLPRPPVDAGSRGEATVTRAASRGELAVTRPSGDGADPAGRPGGFRVRARQVEALSTLALLGRMVDRSTARLGAADRGGAGVPGRAGELVGAAFGEASVEPEDFRLDREADYEHERLISYRVMLAFEIVGAIVLIREIVLRLH
jgi:hypothetical protein